VLFLCYLCVLSITDGLDADLHLDIGGGVSLEKVDGFCCLGDVLDADGDVVRRWRPESGLVGEGFVGACPF